MPMPLIQANDFLRMPVATGIFTVTLCACYYEVLFLKIKFKTKWQIVSTSPSSADVFQSLAAMTHKEKGDAFERVTQLYLTTHSKYQTKLKNV